MNKQGFQARWKWRTRNADHKRVELFYKRETPFLTFHVQKITFISKFVIFTVGIISVYKQLVRNLNILQLLGRLSYLFYSVSFEQCILEELNSICVRLIVPFIMSKSININGNFSVDEGIWV